MKKHLTKRFQSDNIYKLSSRRRQAKIKTLKNLKNFEKSLKKCLTKRNGLWYDIQAVAAEVASPSCSSVNED